MEVEVNSIFCNWRMRNVLNGLVRYNILIIVSIRTGRPSWPDLFSDASSETRHFVDHHSFN